MKLNQTSNKAEKAFQAAISASNYFSTEERKYDAIQKARSADIELLEAHIQAGMTPEDEERAWRTIVAIQNGKRSYADSGWRGAPLEAAA